MEQPVQPPEKALAFLRWFCREDYLEEIEGDLLEVFEKEYQYAPRRAKWRFAWSVIRYVRPEFMKIFEQNSSVMKTIFNFKKSPYGLLLFAAIALLLAIAFPLTARTDLQDKTLFSAPLTTMLWIIPLLLLSLWLLYLLTRRFLYSPTITRLHVLVTVSATILIVLLMYLGISPSRPASESQVEFMGNATQVLFLLFVFGQFAFLANVLLGLFYKKQINSR